MAGEVNPYWFPSNAELRQIEKLATAVTTSDTGLAATLAQTSMKGAPVEKLAEIIRGVRRAAR